MIKLFEKIHTHCVWFICFLNLKMVEMHVFLFYFHWIVTSIDSHFIVLEHFKPRVLSLDNIKFAVVATVKFIVINRFTYMLAIDQSGKLYYLYTFQVVFRVLYCANSKHGKADWDVDWFRNSFPLPSHLQYDNSSSNIAIKLFEFVCKIWPILCCITI